MIKNYINGDLVEPVSEKYFDNFDPAIGEAYGIVPDSDKRDVELAVAAAEAAFPAWAATPPDERSRIMFKIAELIKRDLAEFARAECIDNGKPLTLAKTVDIPRAIKNFEFFASAIHGFASEAHQMDGEAVNYTLRNPVGIVGAISPWNLPLYLLTWKIAPALITGNCVMATPSEITAMTAYLLSEACIEAGLPEGVLSIVHGYGHKVGKAITAHPKIKAMVSFTHGEGFGRPLLEFKTTNKPIAPNISSHLLRRLFDLHAS